MVFVHGLWLLPSSWERWAALFEEAGYVALMPGWPDDPKTVAEAKSHPEVFAGKGIGQVADYEEEIIRRLDRKPVVIGHSFGGLMTRSSPGAASRRPRSQSALLLSAGCCRFRSRRCATTSVALRNPANWNRAVPLTYEQFRYSFANAVGEDEAKELYLGYSVPGLGRGALPGRDCERQPVVGGKGRHEEPRARADADHLGRLGSHRAVRRSRTRPTSGKSETPA